MEFDGNAYRKTVLSAIEARGGVPASDPFEWYDLPLDTKLKDREVRAQVDAVWAFWQKQREAPKYRGLILALLARHEELAPLLWSSDTRAQLAAQCREARAERAVDDLAELDAAATRLVERFGGIPESKVAGLLALAAAQGVSEDAARRRLSRWPVVADQQQRTAVDPYKRARADLEELGRILERPPLPSLFALLDLPPTASRRDVLAARDRVAARNRELLPDRRRALVDDLLAAVTALLVEGDPQAYLSVLAADAVDTLRPRFQAAVLVEDVLTAEDADYLVGEAEALGLDAPRARDVVVQLAREAGVPMPAAARRAEPAPSREEVPEGYRRREKAAPPPASAWHEVLSQARAALRDGAVRQAERLVEQARSLAGGTTPPVRALADEVASVLAEAEGLWQAAASRDARALEALERLQAVAWDVPGPDGRTVDAWLQELRPLLERSAQALAAALALPADQREAALLALYDADPATPGLGRALEELGLPAPSGLTVTVSAGTAVLQWTASPATGRVDYRVVAVEADGRRRVLGSTAGCSLETAALPGPPPSYEVVARRAGVTSAPATVEAAPLPEPVAALGVSDDGRRVRLSFAPAPGVQVHRVTGAVPRPGTVGDLASLGPQVPPAGPGLAMEPVPSGPTGWVAVTVGSGVAVAGASAWWVDVPEVTDVRVEDGTVRWTWPVGVTEVLLVWREDRPPTSAHDPAAQRRKVTNTSYAISGGVPAPEGHLSVWSCTRVDGELAAGRRGVAPVTQT